jgi:hypothetical protein
VIEMKKFTVACIAFAAVTAVAGSAAAEGLELGARLGYGIPMGDSAKDAKMSDGIKSMIPIWIDAGYRIDENLFAGLYFQYGLVQLADDACPDGADCSGSNIRVGVQGQYHLMPAESFDPWLGLGIGYEMNSYKVSAGGQEATGSTSGFEFLNIQAGGDFAVSEGVAIGPFLSFSLGQYSKAKVEMGGNTIEGDIEEKAMHQWLVLGVRGSFQL